MAGNVEFRISGFSPTSRQQLVTPIYCDYDLLDADYWELRTTDATAVNTIVMVGFATSMMRLTADVMALKTDGTVGARWYKTITVRLTAAGDAMVGSVQDVAPEMKEAGAATWSAALSWQPGPGVVWLTTTGQAATTIVWVAEIKHFVMHGIT